MSVYTTVETTQLEAFLRHYDIGDLVSFQGITAGIENTNYFVNTTHDRYVLTLFESLKFDKIPYFLELTAFLAEHNVPCAHPVASTQGEYLLTLNQKPAAFIKRLDGKEVVTPTEHHATALGSALGHMHVVGQKFSLQHANSRGADWWINTSQALEPHLSIHDRQTLKDEIRFQTGFRRTGLATGLTHADLFKDNTLWNGNKLTGIIDYYYACNDVLLYDIAVTVNAWFCDQQGHLVEPLVKIFLKTYNQQRALSNTEYNAWPTLLRAAALRFWLSRLNDMHFPKAGEITHTKNPDEFRNILRSHIELNEQLKQIWI